MNARDIINTIEANRDGRTTSLLNPTSRRLPPIAKSTYWAITGAAGTGKTSLADQLFVLDLIELDSNIKVLYHVLERSKMKKIVKWACYLVYKHEGIVIDFDTFMHHPNRVRTVDDDEFNIMKHYINYLFEEILDKRVFLFAGKANEKKISDRVIKAVNSPKLEYSMLINVVDHAGKVYGEGTDYDVLKRYSNRMGELRDNLDIVHVDIVQLHLKKVNDVHRRRNFGAEILPSDMYGGEIIQQNVDVLLGILHPNAMGISSHRGYDHSHFAIGDDNRFRELKVIKANFSQMQSIPCLFVGEVGKFIEIPKADIIDYDQVKEDAKID